MKIIAKRLRCSPLLLAFALACGSRSGLLGGGEELAASGGRAGAGAGGRPLGGGSGDYFGGSPSGGSLGQGGIAASGGAGAGTGGGGTGAGAGTGAGGDAANGGASGASAASGGAGAGASASGGQAGQGGALGEAGQGGAEALESPIWAKRFGDDLDQYAYAIAVDGAGESAITGRMWGTTDFGQGPLTDPENGNVFVVKFAADGDSEWSKGYGDAGSQIGTGVTLDGTGAVAVSGWFSGNIDFGEGNLASQGGADVFVAKLDVDQNLVFGKAFGASDNQTALGIAATESDDLVIAGEFRNQVDLGGGTLTSAGSNDVLVGRFHDDGGYDWAAGYGNSLAQRARSVATTVDDEAIFVGEFQGKLDFGCGAVTSAGSRDVFLTRFDADGACVSTFQFGDATDQMAYAVAWREWTYARTAIAGSFTGTLDFSGGVTITGDDEYDAYVAVLRDNGSAIWAKRIGGPGAQRALSVAFDFNSDVIVAGAYAGSIDDGTLPPSAGGDDVFVIKYDRFGNLVWAKRFGDEADQVGYAVGADDENNVFVAGAFQSTIPLATGTLTSAGLNDVFVMKLAP